MNAYIEAAGLLVGWMLPLVGFSILGIYKWKWSLDRFTPYVTLYFAVTTSGLAVVAGLRGWILGGIIIFSVLGPWFGWSHYARAWNEILNARGKDSTLSAKDGPDHER